MSETKRLAIGVDIGGTFTDVVVVDKANSAIHSAKVLTTPDEPERAVLNAVDAMLTQTAAAAPEISTIVHGTTLATNAIIERKGAHVVLLTTQGFRDALETRTELRYDLYDLFIQFPEPLVPRRRRIGISERTTYDGVVLSELDTTDVSQALSSAEADGVEAIAVCFLHSYANPENEQAARDAIRAINPDLPITLSSDVLPEIGEYGRVSTTVANAYVQPLIDRYLGALDRALAEKGSSAAFFVMGSNAGTLSLDVARQYPVRLVESGPAAGVSIAAHYARQLETSHLLSFDMGGTTAKISLITDYEPTRTTELEVARVKRFQQGSGLLLKAPAVDLIEIGAGGGSIAAVDDLGLITVGPESAGSSPGPACYGQGGTKATVTDANVALGLLNPDYFLGGKMQLDREKSKAAVENDVAKPLGVTIERAASSIFEVVNDNMANAAAVYSAEQGIDLRRYELLAFGGAAPAHAWDVARRLGIGTVRIPFAAGVLSALGCLTSPMSFDFVFGYMRELDHIDWQHVNDRYDALEAQGRQQLEDAGVDDGVSVTLAADMRYYGQRYEVTVRLSRDDLSENNASVIQSKFYKAYREYYGREIADVPIETVSWRMNVSGPRPELDISWSGRDSQSGRVEPKAERQVVFPNTAEALNCKVYERSDLPIAAEIQGPAIIEDHESTTVVPPGAHVRVDQERMLVLDISGVLS